MITDDHCVISNTGHTFSECPGASLLSSDRIWFAPAGSVDVRIWHPSLFAHENCSLLKIIFVLKIKIIQFDIFTSQQSVGHSVTSLLCLVHVSTTGLYFFPLASSSLVSDSMMMIIIMTSNLSPSGSAAPGASLTTVPCSRASCQPCAPSPASAAPRTVYLSHSESSFCHIFLLLGQIFSIFIENLKKIFSSVKNWRILFWVELERFENFVIIISYLCHHNTPPWPALLCSAQGCILLRPAPWPDPDQWNTSRCWRTLAWSESGTWWSGLPPSWPCSWLLHQTEHWTEWRSEPLYH